MINRITTPIPPPAINGPRASNAITSTGDALIREGIFPYGSAELNRFEECLTRYFSREYRHLMESGVAPINFKVVTDEGPMWKDTAELMEQHFDQSLDLFRCFLDQEFMAYTSAYYGETPDQVRSSSCALEDAERAKFELVCRRAGIRGGERVFNLGCGFGPLETYLFAAYPNIEITSITPSRVQAGYIRQQRRNPAHPLSRGELRLIEGDFGRVPLVELGEQGYDVVFAVGAFEHANNLHSVMERIASLLKPNGTAFVHSIVSIPVIPKFLDAQSTLIRKYFPGGRIWPFEIIKRQTDYFSLKASWFINGMNYWKTLDAWHRNFWTNIENLYKTILDEEGIRHWNEYFSLSKACFAPFDGSLFGNGHYLFQKRPD